MRYWYTWGYPFAKTSCSTMVSLFFKPGDRKLYLWAFRDVIFSRNMCVFCTRIPSPMALFFLHPLLTKFKSKNPRVVVILEEKLRGLLAKLFNKMDDSHTGTLTLSDIEKHFDDEQVRALFETLEPKLETVGQQRGVSNEEKGPQTVRPRGFLGDEKQASFVGIIRNHDKRIPIRQDGDSHWLMLIWFVVDHWFESWFDQNVQIPITLDDIFQRWTLHKIFHPLIPLTRWVSSDATQELKATDAWTLFQSIDHNEDFKINLEESKPGGWKWIPSSWGGGGPCWWFSRLWKGCWWKKP